ncbi:TOM1-like protein 2 isoform X2 [Paramacrobiotus metropolitanus]|uniref:TOM1-like protein 2 isoform X2 n=1 Tax=Paramacrobiotus metropolitanus TaxID=2943436 RepID=UPI0024460FF3|nr:TOM1-like protein 2 isoform X2 [Paramacrobiotus metropolitanus]
MSVAGLKDTVTDLFSGNPFATEVGHRIEQATDPKLGAENWALFMEICDLVNENEESAKDAARAIKKRLNNTVQTKDFEATLLTLTVLETCVKNCGKRFHVLICSKDYISEIVKLIGPKFEPPVILQERVLGLIQNWAETFRNSPDLHGVTEVYNELKGKGVEFPVLDLETMAPIITPQRTVAPQPQTVQTPRRTSLNTQQQQQMQPQGPQQTRLQESAAVSFSAGPVNMTPEQLAKLRGEVDIVKSNMQVFSEMLGEMKPGQEEPEDLQLLMDLHTTLRSMQDRVVQLLTSVSNEEVTGELLVVNDEMNALFMRYERYERQRKGASSVQSRALPQPPQQSFEPSTLIDFAEGNRSQLNDMQNQMSSMAIGRKPQPQPPATDQDPAADFGAFAQSRVAVHSQQATTPTPTSELPKDTELEEMEHWLKSQPEAARGPSQAPERPTLTSAEFDRFLESRVAAAEQLPSINTNNRATSEQAPKHETSHLLDS